MRAEKSLEKVSRSYKKFAREFAIITNEMERNARLEAAHKEGLTRGLTEGRVEGHAEGKAEGHAEGIAEGHAEEKLEIARKMIKSGLPLGEIAEFTGLSVETIRTLG